MIKLTEFLTACNVLVNMDSYKVHLATSVKFPPLDAFFAGTFMEWQDYQTKRNFQCYMVIGLIAFKKDKWLFAGVYKVLDCKHLPNGHYRYKTKLLPKQNELIGRIVVNHKRTGRASYLKGKKDGGEFYVSEITEKKLSVEEFPGYNAVTVPYSKLKIIIDQHVSSWHGALSNIKGVYLITDLHTGMQYVGSAVGDSGIWQRWGSYVKTGHGGNKELRQVLREEGPDYFKNFQYSILEIADIHASDEFILARESYWKDALGSREFGYNSN
jgi:hypothetical protein